MKDRVYNNYQAVAPHIRQRVKRAEPRAPRSEFRMEEDIKFLLAFLLRQERRGGKNGATPAAQHPPLRGVRSAQSDESCK